ncbi:DUF86 domain-containing protein [Altericista sp. CCNU0014]|uniref:HepT-like ribonuclease domain-containing protein n=1 Tax=Altericista sp. CCNU0014 TaxID=3082949 RepID=UPI00384A6240
MPNRKDIATLLDIQRASQKVIQFQQGISKTDFMEDDKTQSAIVFQLMIVGEAVKRLSQEFRTLHPEIPWQLIAGMRDKLIHHYDDIDWAEVWKTATTDIPVLLSQINPLIPQPPHSEG